MEGVKKIDRGRKGIEGEKGRKNHIGVQIMLSKIEISKPLTNWEIQRKRGKERKGQGEREREREGVRERKRDRERERKNEIPYIQTR